MRQIRRRARALHLAAAALLALACVDRFAYADHEASFYPSFYPQEIRIEALDPASVAAGWPKARVHAYAGADPFEGRAAPADAAAVESLRGLVALTFDPPAGHAPVADGRAARCAAAKRIAGALAPGVAGFVFHPYPVTPYHDDYLDQFDLVRRAQAQYAAAGSAADAGALRVRARGAIAQALAPAPLRADADGWDATLEEFDVGDLVTAENGSLALPWAKQGWFQAARLWRGAASADAAAASDAAYRRLVTGDYRGPAQRIDLERRVVSTLAGDCRRVVVGYTLRREYFDTDYSNGVENVAFDSQAGLDSNILPRSIKLKDFPWNGWLRVGTAARPEAAWNPVAGFGDPFGRLLWRALGDPPLLPDPYGGSWIANRVSVVEPSHAPVIAIPQDALRPDAQSGELRPVGAGKTARKRLRYAVVMSDFHDGTATDVADILYPYALAYRWSAGHTGSARFDPAIAAGSALLREWLAGVKVIGAHTLTRDYGGDFKFSYRVLDVDVYLAHRSSDAMEAAAIAPPWSTLPWEVVALMEQAVERGLAAFSAGEAQRRGIPWLDLARDRALGERLAALTDELRDRAYRPAALESLVSASEARRRWSALRAYYDQHRHFLVTNGPYRLDAWNADGAVLQVFRDPSYPQGVGTYDDYAIPRRGFVTRIDDRGDRLDVAAEVEEVSRFQRSYEITRAAVGPPRDDQPQDERPQCRYVVIAPGGSVARTGTALPGRNGLFAVDLQGLSEPGAYTVMVAVFVPPNRMNPEVAVVMHRIPAARARQVPAT